MFCIETTAPRMSTLVAGTIEGKGWASAVELLHGFLHEDRQGHRRNGERQHAVAQHRVDEQRLKPQPRSSIVTAKPIAPRPERQADIGAASMKKAGSMTNSPWAKLIVCEVCQSSVKPIATSA